MLWLRKFGARALLLAGIVAVPAGAQTASDTSVFYISPDEYEITVPTTCPNFLRGGFTGMIYGYEHAGYTWDTEWTRTRFVTVGSDVADYVPTSGSQNLYSRDDRAIWYDAGIRVRCTATRRYFMGRMISSTERYRVIYNFGNVVPRGDSERCGEGEYIVSTGDSLTIGGSVDDEMASEVPSGCGGGGGGSDPDGDGGDDSRDGNSGDDGSGTSGSTFAAQCDSLGGRLYYDIVSLVRWNESTGVYDTVWTGVAAICET